MRLISTVQVSPASSVGTCPLAAAWVLFERNTLQPAAKRHLGSEVTGVRHLGTYACRNVNHVAVGHRSQHATANAIDIAGFVLRGGREVTLAGTWLGVGPDAAFLHAVRDGACRWFRVVLSPDYDAAHQDHLHLEPGQAFCR